MQGARTYEVEIDTALEETVRYAWAGGVVACSCLMAAAHWWIVHYVEVFAVARVNA